MILSPALAIYRIWKAKDVGIASVFPFVTTLANANIWMIYGYLTHNYNPIFGTFVAGDDIAVAYLAIYWCYATDKRRVLNLLAPTVAALLALSVYAILAGLGYTGQTRKQAGSTFGYIADAVAVCLYGAPFECIFQVVKYKSAVFIQLPMVLAGTTNNALWLTYALMVDNWFLLASNMLFLAIGAASMTLFVIYNPATHPLADCLSTSSRDSSA